MRNSYAFGASVRPREDDLPGGLPAGIDARAGAAGLIERDAADGGPGLVLDALLILGGAVPVAAHEPPLDGLFQLVVVFRLEGMLVAEAQRAVEQRLLDLRSEERRVGKE